MKLEQRRQVMHQLHLSDQKFNCLLKCVLYQRLDGKYRYTCIHPGSFREITDRTDDFWSTYMLALKRQRWEVEWFDEDECLLKHELTTHTGKPVTMTNTAWWNYKQKQSKPKLSISSSSKLINTILELPMNSQSIYKMHRWNARVYQLACCRLGTKPHHALLKTYHIS